MNEHQMHLIVERGPIPPQSISLEQDQLSVGRSNANDLVMADPEVSRKHARLLRDEAGGYGIEDLGSTNGTFVNGERISHLTALQNGDAIELGDTVRLRYAANVAELPTSIDLPLPSIPAAAAVSASGRSSAVQVDEPPPVAWRETAVYDHRSAPVEDEDGRRNVWLGCGLLLVLGLLCVGTFALLDAFQGGRLIICGPLESIFGAVLGPLGVMPVCP